MNLLLQQSAAGSRIYSRSAAVITRKHSTRRPPTIDCDNPLSCWNLRSRLRFPCQIVAEMEAEAWNCSGTASSDANLMSTCVEMASNFTDSGGGSVAHVSQLPRSLYTPTCRVYDFVIETILMGSLCLFGFAGNTLSMICLRHDKSHSATPLLLISLEISDTLFLSAVLVVRVISSFQVHTYRAPITLASL